MPPSARMRSTSAVTASVEEVAVWLRGITYKDGWSFTRGSVTTLDSRISKGGNSRPTA